MSLAKEIRRDIAVSAFVLLASITSVTLAFQSCASASPRHVATGSSTVIFDSLTAIQQLADGEVTSGAMTSAQRTALAKHLLPALQTGKDFNATVLNWQPGTATPANVQTLITNLGQLIGDVVGDFTNAATQAKAQAFIATAEGALLTILAALGS